MNQFWTGLHAVSALLQRTKMHSTTSICWYFWEAKKCKHTTFFVFFVCWKTADDDGWYQSAHYPGILEADGIPKGCYMTA